MNATTTKPASFTLNPPVHTDYRFFRSIEEAGSDWDNAAPAEDIFLQRHFLSVIEKHPPRGTSFGYLVFYKQSRPAGVALCQFKYFKGDDNIQELDSSDKKETCFYDGLALWFKRRVAGMASADILICGNILLTGEHGWYFNDSLVEENEAVHILETALGDVVKIMAEEGVRIPVILVKDIAPEREVTRDKLVRSGFVEFDIQPNMVLELPFRSFDAYLGAMSTKYRTRTKRAFKKFDGIERRELSLEDIERELPVIYRLYKEVASNAGFNMVDLTEDYFTGMKDGFGDYFRLFGYFREGKMVAFYSTIQNHKELEAHFIGYDKSLNHEYQLYMNILYDIIRLGIDSGSSRIIFARTALEIKSSVGAEAHPLWNYLRHQNQLANRFTATILDYLKPVETWLPRHPFKDSSAEISE
ncbi:MAG: GNAT family N-acetyltransferase [Bacteroidota bacterium]